jgi:hypothetical protein
LYRTRCLQCVFVKTHSLGLKNIITSGTRIFFDHIAVSRCAERPLTLVKSRPKRRPGRALAQAKSGLVPREAGFPFGQIRTDAALRACVYSGRIVALCRVKRAFPSVKSGPTQRSRHAFTPAESWPRVASSGLFLRSNQERSGRAFTPAESWPRAASSGLFLRSRR